MAKLVDPRAEPDSTGAKSWLFVLAGPLLGLVIAFSISLLAESMDHTLRTPVDVEKYMGKPVLASLPLDKSKGAAQRLIPGSAKERPSLPVS